MRAPVRIGTTLIRPSLNGRAVDQDRVKAIASSIEEIGLRTPITVRPAEKVSNGRKIDAYEIVAGQHRYQAVCRLGWTEIDCFVSDDDDVHAALWEIDENLMRAELTPVDRASLTARRKAIYEELHPETREHVAGAHGSNKAQGNASANLAPAFTADTAAKTGKSERAVQRDAHRGERIAPEVLHAIRGTQLDKGSYLDSLAKMEPAKQLEKAKKDISAPKPTSAKKIKPTAAPVETSPGQWEMPPADKLRAEVQELKNLFSDYSYEAQRLVALWVLDKDAA